MLFCLSAVIGGENFDGDPRTEPERIHENLALVNIRKLGVAIIELLQNLLLLVRKRCQQIVVMVCNVPHKLFGFFFFATAVCVRAYIAIEQLF